MAADTNDAAQQPSSPSARPRTASDGAGGDQQQPASHPRPNKRSRRNEYVPQACVPCRRRKVKCPAGVPCLECQKAGETCEYTENRRRKRTTTAGSASREKAHKQSSSSTGPTAPLQRDQAVEELPESVRVMLSRLSNLEQEYSSLRSTVQQPPSPMNDFNTQRPQSNPPLRPQPPVMQRSPQSQASPHPRSVPSQHQDPEQNGHVSDYDVRAESSLLQPIAALDRSAQKSGFSQPGTANAHAAPIDHRIIALESDPRIAEAERAVRVNNGANFRSALPIAFMLNSCHPLLNEHQFRASFDDFVFDTDHEHKSMEKYQFLALIYLIHADTELQSGHNSDPGTVLGWEKFEIADKILREVGVMMKGNLLTIKCLLIKARYLLCAEKFDSAYETVSHAVRLCFQNNLHNQPVWSANLDGFQLTMRQRIFWSTFTMERLVASTCGLPFFIRESDVRVDFPKLYDDQGLFPNRPLPEETPGYSYIPYQVASIKWAQTYSHIWDKMFGVNAEKPIAQEQFDALDAKVLQQASELPLYLQWSPTFPDGAVRAPSAPFMKRQRLICHMRVNHSRLLVRQPSMMSLGFPRLTADECLAIAASSINACHDYFHSSHYDIDRYFMNHYLTGAIIPLACIILRRDMDEELCREADRLFHKAMALLESISDGYLLAQRMVKRLQGILHVAQNSTAQGVLVNAADGGIFGGHAADGQGWSGQMIPNQQDFGRIFPNGGANGGVFNAEESNHLMSQFLISNINTPLNGFQWDGVEMNFGGTEFG